MVGDGSEIGEHNLLIEEEMKQSYLTYAMSVLVDRALPDIRDGLKPVHRRILYSMRDLSLQPGSKYTKSAKIVGQCIGNYHPHGDSAVYDAMVRMAQDFSLRYELVDGQGNFGSIDGDAPAAYRYTEARMTRAGVEMLDDIQFDTVDHRPNFDESRDEPIVLPARLPNLLLNGSSGIAVGMATNIPPHHLGEVCSALVHLVDEPAATVDDLMQFVQGPDFPTGAYICGRGGIRQAYETGRGRVVMRARIHEEKAGDRDLLVITEIPYGIKLATIVESIAKADRDETVKGISSMHGGTVKEGIRLVLELKRGEDPDVVINQLWKHTSLQHTFSINMVALDGGRPRTVGLKRLMQAWIDHRIEVIVRRTRFLLARDEARLHIVAGLLRAIDVIDEIIALIRASQSTEEARTGLMERFEFSERQAQAILDMQLRRLTGLERDKLIAERDDLEARIADYRDILAREERQYGIIKDDLRGLMERYGEVRRSEIVEAAGDLAMEDLIEDEECVVTLTRSGYIKRLPIDTYRTQRRGGKGVIGGRLKDDDDYVAQLYLATNHQYLLIFTTAGKVYWLKVYEIPQAGRTSRGKALANVLNLADGERITTTIPVRDFPDDRFITLATAGGQISKTVMSAYSRPRTGGIRCMTLAEGDEMIAAIITGGDDQVFIATSDGQACRFHEVDVRPTGRTAAGVRGVSLGSGARVVSFLRIEEGKEVLTICENGMGKRTPYDEYRLTRRGGKGVININAARNGEVVASLMVDDSDEVLLISRAGMVVRTRVEDVRITGRAAGGVRIIRLDEGDLLTGVAKCESTGEPRTRQFRREAGDPGDPGDKEPGETPQSGPEASAGNDGPDDGE